MKTPDTEPTRCMCEICVPPVLDTNQAPDALRRTIPQPAMMTPASETNAVAGQPEAEALRNLLFQGRS